MPVFIMGGIFGGGSSGPWCIEECTCGHYNNYHGRNIPLPDEPPEHYNEVQRRFFLIDKKIGCVAVINACELCECNAFKGTGYTILT